MTNLENILGPATPELLDPQYAVVVVRHMGAIHWLLLNHDNLMLDLKKRRDEFVAAGYQYPDLNTVAGQRSGIVIFDQNTAEDFLAAPGAHKLNLQFLRQALLERFPGASLGGMWAFCFRLPSSILITNALLLFIKMAHG